ncbi:S66 peptidase family protein [Flavihumibacter petaseus]|uniref:Putative murein peptide carboxypeptidase n=1 Tax=Flavihumibacter petaseus NBRC 106054 TaxID=1220578 RepID=A0A0E9N568_9BACT|nr:LD-carboxypeptidase [Flavihumibacter petaseus]GAO44943.1 putative murein peptide carboxypeptidase [Flavihumibacter petaseus NBRC 106054]
MLRKEFLRLNALALPTFLLPPGGVVTGDADGTDTIRVPAYLRPGDTIAVTSPAGYITMEEIMPAKIQMESWGLRVKPGNTIGKRDGTFGGTDQERLADFQQLLDDPTVQAVMCARGGYGLVRLIDQLDFSRFRKHPKWLIGFSDVTVLHAHLNRVVRVASIHSKMCNSFPDNWITAEPLQQETILSIRDALMGKPMRFSLPANPENQLGVATGELIGGNCKTIESLAGSLSDIRTHGKILFVEDTGEYLYSIDRMFWNLKRSGKLNDLAALIVGGFKVKPSEDPAEEFNRNLYQIVKEKISDCSYPVCFDFPVGHQRNNYALKCGVNIQLKVNYDGVYLSEYQNT